MFTNNTFQIYVDRVLAYEGSLLTSLTPPINPEEMISDPTDTKPASWDDRPTIPDPNARKPDWWCVYARPSRLKRDSNVSIH